jgi:hypothetical protein
MTDDNSSQALAKKIFPNEKFTSSTRKLKSVNRFTRDMEIPQGVFLAESRIPRTKGDADKLRKELRQAGILARLGNTVYLTPEPGRFMESSFDAIVNGMPYEFRNITGSIKKIERRFTKAKEKADNMNVFINIDSDIIINEIRRRIGMAIGRHPEYTGKIIVSILGEKIYFWDTMDFK